ncbi:hypothetical protein C3L33_11982, partial [Rhododendron williamsianum]
MAPNPKTLCFLLNLTILLALATHALSAGRIIPAHSENTDPKKPQWFIDTDGSFLVPGVGRYTFPGVGTPFNPFTYNPVTGTSGGVATPTGLLALDRVAVFQVVMIRSSRQPPVVRSQAPWFVLEFV